MSKRQKVVLSDEPITQRIHVGGLAPSVTPRELVARFSSFGQIQRGVDGVDGLGVSASGLPRSYAFFNLETSQAKLQRCMSMLNGSMWKSHKLRIAPAKPAWEQRCEEERKLSKEAENPASALAGATTAKKRKRKLSSDPTVGYTAKRFEIVTPENIENHKGWILDAKPHSDVPLFPLVVRPSHPIYLPPKAAATSWTRGKSSEDKERKRREKDLAAGGGGPGGERTTTRDKKPLIRIKRMRIDPRKYGRKKVVYPATTNLNEDATMTGVGHWECLEPEAEAARRGASGEEVTWVFKANQTGQVKLRETVKLSGRHVEHTDQFKALLDKLQLPECAKPQPQPQPQTRHDATTAEKTPADADAANVVSASTVMSNELAKVDVDLVLPRSSPPMTSARARSLSPPPYVPSAPRQLLYNEEDAFQLRVSSLDEQTQELEAKRERERLVRLAMGIVEDEDDSAVTAREEGEDHKTGSGRSSEAIVVSKSERKTLPKVEGFANDESDDDEVFEQQAAMRLRGGGGVSSDDSDSSSDSEDDDDDDDDDDDETKPASTVAAAVRPTKLVQESLKDMFKPQEEQPQGPAFSLFSGLDLDLDLEGTTTGRSPSPEPVSIPIPSALPPPPPKILPVYRQNRRELEQQQQRQVAPGPGYSFFGTLDVVDQDEPVVQLGDHQQRENDQRLKDCGLDDWWKNQPQDEIDEAHAKLRESLRGFSRKRHRESVKRTKKTGGHNNPKRGGGGAAVTFGGFTLDTLATAAEE